MGTVDGDHDVSYFEDITLPPYSLKTWIEQKFFYSLYTYILFLFKLECKGKVSLFLVYFCRIFKVLNLYSI